MYIDIICSWCNKHLSTKVIGKNSREKHRVSHTICPACREKVMNEYKKNMRSFATENTHKISL